MKLFHAVVQYVDSKSVRWLFDVYVLSKAQTDDEFTDEVAHQLKIDLGGQRIAKKRLGIKGKKEIDMTKSQVFLHLQA